MFTREAIITIFFFGILFLFSIEIVIDKDVSYLFDIPSGFKT